MCTGEGALDPSLFYQGADSDPYCCETKWDEVCAFECMMVCGYECPLPEDYQWKETTATYTSVGAWSQTGDGKLTAPLKIALGPGGRLLYVLDVVKSQVLVYRLFL